MMTTSGSIRASTHRNQSCTFICFTYCCRHYSMRKGNTTSPNASFIKLKSKRSIEHCLAGTQLISCKATIACAIAAAANRGHWASTCFVVREVMGILFNVSLLISSTLCLNKHLMLECVHLAVTLHTSCVSQVTALLFRLYMQLQSSTKPMMDVSQAAGNDASRSAVPQVTTRSS